MQTANIAALLAPRWKICPILIADAGIRLARGKRTRSGSQEKRTDGGAGATKADCIAELLTRGAKVALVEVGSD